MLINNKKSLERRNVMMKKHHISEYIDNLPLQKKFCMGYRPDEVYEVICTLSSMYNEILSEDYEENEILRRRLDLDQMGNYAGEGSLNQAESEKNSIMQETITAEKSEGTQVEEKRQTVVVDKGIQHLKRSELLEIMLDMSRENDALKLQQEDYEQRIANMKLELEKRHIAIKEAGSIAEASLRLNGVFDSAQSAAEQYLENLQELYEQKKAGLCRKEEELAKRCSDMVAQTQEKCNQMEEETIKRCKMLEDKAKEAVDKRWEDLAKRLEAFYNQKDSAEEIRATVDSI